MKKTYINWLKMFYGTVLAVEQIEALAHAMVSEFGAYFEGMDASTDFEFVVGGRKATKSSAGKSRIDAKHKVEIDTEPTALMRLAMVLQDAAKFTDRHAVVIELTTLPAGVRTPAKREGAPVAANMKG